MKNYFLFLLLFLYNLSFGQKIVFEYDDAGNQKLRRFVCITCPGRKAKDSDYKNVTTLTDSDLIKDDLYDQISYYSRSTKCSSKT